MAAGHLLVGAAFLVLGGLIQLLALFSLRFAAMSPLSYGRLEPMATLTLMIGFLVISMTGGAYYVLPRLTGARLRSVASARAGLALFSLLTVVGILAIAFGFGDGQGPVGLPWWLDLPLALALFIPAYNVVGTIRRREETHSYVTLWFLIAGSIWLPLVYLAHTVATTPWFDSLARTYGGLFLSGGFLTMWVLTVGSGLFYYSVVKELDIPLASRQLAAVGLWSVGIASVWSGVAQLIFGPGPGWTDAVAAALGLALPIATLANASNVSLTVQGHWEELGERPGLVAGVVGLFGAVVIGAMASLASFRAIGSVAALTGFWEAIEYAALLGVGPLLMAGTAFDAMPRIAGREIPSIGRARSFVRLTVIGVGGAVVTMAASGLVTGYSWLAGSNSAAFPDTGEGWGAGAGAADPLLLIAFGFAVVAFLGQLAYASTVIGAVTVGKAVPQEVLVYSDAEPGDE